MNNFHVPVPLVDRLGWVLVHSVWQFALLALAALVLMRATRRCSAASRYTMLLLALAAMVASPVVTLVVLPVDESMVAAEMTSDQNDPAGTAERRDVMTTRWLGLAASPEPVGDTRPDGRCRCA